MSQVGLDMLVVTPKAGAEPFTCQGVPARCADGKLGAQLTGQPFTCLPIQLRIRYEDQPHAHYVARARIHVTAAHPSRP